MFVIRASVSGVCFCGGGGPCAPRRVPGTLAATVLADHRCQWGGQCGRPFGGWHASRSRILGCGQDGKTGVNAAPEKHPRSRTHGRDVARKQEGGKASWLEGVCLSKPAS